MADSTHTWRFFRAGGFDQVKLETGADLLNLEYLDQKLWVALACPASGLEFDPQTLALIDADKDGRIRAPELIAAIKWAGGLLRDPDELVRAREALPLASINEDTAEGKAVANSARTVLANLGKADAAAISSADTADVAKIFAQTVFNGDGVIVADSASEDATKAVIADIIACVGSVPDRSGKPGVDQAKVDAFYAELAAYDTWIRKSEDDASTVLPLGSGTAAAAAAVRATKSKVDDYFGRCRLATFDLRALAALNREEKEYLALAAKDLSITAAEISGFPLAVVAPGKAMPLGDGINPAWAAAITALRNSAVVPLLGERTELTESDWASVTARLGAFECWQAGKAGAAVEKLGVERVRAILAGNGKAAIGELLAKDKAEESNANAIANVDRLVRYVRDLHRLATNFVNFQDFYDSGGPAIFQVGTLFLDQRSCSLCLSVENAARHAAMAGLAGTYLAYVDCVRKGGEKRSVMAAFTNGDSDNLMVGRNGVFYDRKGRDWDATITKIIDNPISVRQAFWSPYKKLVRMIEEQVAKRAAAADAEANTKLASAASTAANVDKAKPAEPKKVDVGAVAAMGVAVGAIGTAFATIAGYGSGLLKLPFWQVCLALVGLLMLVSGPSMLIAWLKLRKRNLGPILDANGWAVNAKARINVPFGASLTSVAKLPAGAQAALGDRFAEAPPAWPKLLGFVVAVCFTYSLANHFDLAPVLNGEGRVAIPRFDERTKAERAAAKARAAAEEAEKKAAETAPAK